MKNIPAVILSLFFLLGSFFLTKEMIFHTNEYQEKKVLVVNDVLNFQNRLLNVKEALPEIWKNEWKDKKERVDELTSKADKSYDKAVQFGLYLILMSLVYFLLMMIFYFKSKPIWAVVFSFMTISIALMYTGVTAPIMELSAFNDDLKIPIVVTDESVSEELVKWKWMQKMIPDFELDLSREYEGRMYYFYQNKSIIGVSKYLWSGGDQFLSVLILTFSVILPLFKAFATIVMLFSKKLSTWNRLKKMVSVLSKFSMADVFVVALLMTFLSTYNMSLPIESESKVLLGLYFFIGSVLLAILSSVLIDYSVRKIENRIEFKELGESNKKRLD